MRAVIIAPVRLCLGLLFPAFLFLASCMQSPGSSGTAEAAAAAGGQGQPVCLWIRDISGFTAEGSKAVTVTTGPSKRYRLDLMGPCLDLPWVEAVGFDGLHGQLCAGANPNLLVKGDKCPIIAITPLPPDPAPARGAPAPASGG